MKLDDVFKTRTMARILASQGQIKKAKSIYAYLLKQNPHDAEIKTEMDMLDNKKTGSKNDAQTDGTKDLDILYTQWIKAAFSYFRKER